LALDWGLQIDTFLSLPSGAENLKKFDLLEVFKCESLLQKDRANI